MARNNYPNKLGKLKRNKTPVEAALRFLSYRARSEKEVRDKLKKRFTPEEIDLVIQKFKEWNLLNDAQFAQSYVESRARSKPRSKRMIEMELKRKGVKLDFDLPQSDLELANAALEKKKNLRSFKQAVRFLQSRGFSWEVIEKVLKNRYNDDHVS